MSEEKSDCKPKKTTWRNYLGLREGYDIPFSNDGATKAGVKHDDAKPRTDLLLDFRNALLAVADVTTFGAQKYRPHDWIHVQDGYTRYQAALVRHLLQEGVDEESGLDHLAHLAWNALAILELKIRGQQEDF